jgi:N-acetylglutamate synthase-like GNAT family acetyltransferase
MSRPAFEGRPRVGATLRDARPSDLPAVIGLLSAASLPTAGVPVALEGFVIAESAGELIGVAGLERYGPAGLLRSVAVRPESRKTGVGGALVDRILADAAARGLSDIFLLTTTAESYFARRGFSCIGREAVPEPVQASVEFRGVCPSTAVVMHRGLALLDAQVIP